MRRARVSTLMAVALVLGNALGASAAPGGGGNSSAPSFSITPASVSITTPATVAGFATVTVTAKKSTAVASPAISSNPAFSDTRGGTCWTEYSALGRRLPMKTSCTIQIRFLSASTGTSSGTLTVTECTATHVDGSGTLACDMLGASTPIALSGTATAAPLPDLTVESVVAGPGTNYSFVVHNVGAGPASLAGVGYQGWYSADLAIDGGDGGACGSTLTGSLAAGATMAVSATCSGVPPATAQYLLVNLDFSNALAETNESNNVGVGVLPTGQPDLIVTSITILDADATAPTNYDVVVTNAGTGTVAVEQAIAVQGWLSVDAVVDAGDTAACFALFGTTAGYTLAPGASETVHVSCTVRPSVGQTYLLAQADATGSVTESDETNNVARRSLPEVDLSVLGLTVNSAGAGGIDLTTTIRLAEFAPSPQVALDLGGLGITAYYSTDGSTRTSTACGGFVTAPRIVPANSNFTFNLVCATAPQAGETWVIVVIDTNNLIAESNELNNTATLKFGIPDLSVSPLVITDSTNMGGWIYAATIRNMGFASVAAGVAFQGSWSKDQILDGADGSACEGATSVVLTPGASQTVSVTCFNTPSRAHLYLIVVVDNGNGVAELDETNNVTVTALPPH